MKTGQMAFAAALLINVSLSAVPAIAQISVDDCNALLSGEPSELTAAIRDLSRLRYNLDVAASQGDSSVVKQMLQDAYEKKEAEILHFAKINQVQLITRIRTEIESIQKEAKTKEARQSQTKEKERKEVRKAKDAERLLKTGTFALIKAGTFTMGAGDPGSGAPPTSKANKDFNEIPHVVTLTRDYEMQTTLVTQQQYFAVTGENPSKFKDKEHCPETWVEELGCPENPVESLSWGNIQIFIQNLNAQDDGYIYRLPTEAEWEYAARAKTTTAYYWGDSMDDDYAWHEKNSNRQTHEVARKKPNPYGLYDMSGNLAEWVSDWFESYPSSAVIDPQGPSSGTSRTLRGGGWREDGKFMRSSYRGLAYPESQNSLFGFRLVRVRRS